MDNTKPLILIVDDNVFAVKIIRDIILTFNYSPRCLIKPKYLFQVLQKVKFNAIILDINMPEVDGFSLLQQIKSHPVFHTIPVIILTGESSKEMMSDCLKSGAFDYLVKPVNTLVLQTRLNSALSTKILEEITVEKQLNMERIKQQNLEAEFAKLKLTTSVIGLPEGLQENLNQILLTFFANSSWNLLEHELKKTLIRITSRFYENISNLINLSLMQSPEDIDEQKKQIDFLKKISIFEDLSAFDLANFAKYMEEIVVPISEDLLIQKACIDYVYFIIEGQVAIIMNDEVIGHSGPFGLIGEMPCFRGENISNTTVRTETVCRLYRIKTIFFMNIVEFLPIVWKNIFKYVLKQLDNSNNRFSELLQHTTQGLVKLNREGRITGEISAKGMFYLGITEHTGQFFDDILFSGNPEKKKQWRIIYPLLFENALANIDRLISQLPDECYWRHPTLGQRTYFLFYYPCFNDENQIIAVDVCIEDMTDLIKATQVMKLAKESAEESDRSKTSFLAKMSHEMRTPLNGIIGFAELLLKNKNIVKHYGYTNLILQESNILLELINSLLDLSKIQAGKFELDNQPFNLDYLLEEVNSMMGLRVRQKGLDYYCEKCNGLPLELIGDKGRLRQILINLIGNSIKFTEKGTISVHVTYEMEKSMDVRLHFEVKDTGIGISEEQLPHIFDGFTQADSSITRKYGGTGLGTTISKELAEMMGGESYVNSKLGSGTSFFFSVLFQKVSDPVIIKQLHTEHKKENGTKNKKWNARILLAEDYKTNQLIAIEYLNKFGCQIDIAENGELALNNFKQHAYDMVLMDIHMPIMDGLTATRLIRAYETEVNANVITPIVALTAAVYSSDQKECFEAGINDILPKPFQMEHLFYMLDKWINKDKGYIVTDESTATDESMRDDPLYATNNNNHAEIPVTLQGLELHKAMSALNFDQLTFKRILDTFLEENAVTMNTIREAYVKKEWNVLKRLAHSLKSTSGNIGAYKLQKTALALEIQSKAANESPPDALLIQDVGYLLEEVLQSLKTVCKPLQYEPEKIPEKIIDKEELRNLLQEFVKAIHLFDTDSINQLLKRIGLVIDLSVMQPLEKHVDNYDYDEALDEIYRIADRYGIVMIK
ncbi:MAG: response regulator [Desulfobacterales bacterium]|nr:response regulator [Desulfobacterales bacterium]